MPTLTKWAIEKDKAVVGGVGQGAPTAMAFFIYLDMAKVKVKPFFKMNFEDIEFAEEFFENDKHFSEFFVAAMNYYRGKDFTIKTKIVQKYFNNYKKTMDFIIEAKTYGKNGALKKAENQEDTMRTLKGGVEGGLQETLPTNNKLLNSNNKLLSKNDKELGFDFFWDQYHDITSMPKTDKEPALKHWKKLTETERNLAIEKITDYYDSVENKKYVKKARTYLADKSFNDEHVNAEKKEEQYPDAVKMLAALGGYGPSIYPAIVKRLHEVQYKSEFGFDGILKVAVMAVENFGERGVNAYTWKAIESIDDPELRRDFRNRVKSHGYDAIHQRMVKKYLNETN